MGDVYEDAVYNDYNILTNEYTDDDLTEELAINDIKCIVVTELANRLISILSATASLEGLLTITEAWVAENRDHVKTSRLDELGWVKLEERALDFQNLLRDVEQDRRNALNVIVDWRLTSSQPASLTCESGEKRLDFDADSDDEDGNGEGDFDLADQFISLNGMRVRLLCESENRLKNYVVRRRELAGAFMREMLRIYTIYLSSYYTGSYHCGVLPQMSRSDLSYIKSLGLTI